MVPASMPAWAAAVEAPGACLPCVQKDVAGGADYCRRKVLLVKDKVEQLSQLVKERQAMLGQVEAALEQKLGEQAAAQQQQRAAAQQAAAAGPAAAQT